MSLSESERLRLALDMAGFGIEMQRRRLRREHPGAQDTEIAALLNAWLQYRPGAPDGDCTPSVSAPSVNRQGRDLPRLIDAVL